MRTHRGEQSQKTPITKSEAKIFLPSAPSIKSIAAVLIDSTVLMTMMFQLLVLFLVATAEAFTPPILRLQKTQDTSTQLSLKRRDLLITGIMGLLAVEPAIANAKGSTWFYDDKIEEVREENQMSTGGKVDLNSAFVVRTQVRFCRIGHGDYQIHQSCR
jgi:hypothetical protein